LQGKRVAPFYCRKDVLLFSGVAIKVPCENSRYNPILRP